VGPRALLLLVSLGALRDPSCGTDTTTGGPNAPCTRNKDCEDGLSCTQGVCVSPDAGAPEGGTTSEAGISDAARDD
jgi:hypothetical protein